MEAVTAGSRLQGDLGVSSAGTQSCSWSGCGPWGILGASYRAGVDLGPVAYSDGFGQLARVLGLCSCPFDQGGGEGQQMLFPQFPSHLANVPGFVNGFPSRTV